METNGQETPYDDAAVLAGASRAIVLGEKEFVIREPKRGRAKGLRPQFAKLAGLLTRAAGAEALGQDAQATGIDPELDLEDDMLAMVCGFSPELEAARAYIEEEALPSQILAAWFACLEMMNDPLECTAITSGRRMAGNRAARRAAVETMNGNIGSRSSMKS